MPEEDFHLSDHSRFQAHIAWAIGPGTSRPGSRALKARNDSEGSLMLFVSVTESRFRAFSAGRLIHALTQGVALGFYISRLWRWELEF